MIMNSDWGSLGVAFTCKNRPALLLLCAFAVNLPNVGCSFFSSEPPCYEDTNCLPDSYCDVLTNTCRTMDAGPVGIIEPDGGASAVFDGGVIEVDGGGYQDDAGALTDGGHKADAGDLTDGGHKADAGAFWDAGHQVDAGLFTDGGVMLDAGPIDGGPQLPMDGGDVDGGTQVDAGVNCGNGIIDDGETCDGDCPLTCVSSDPCLNGFLTGSPDLCTAICLYDEIISCENGDGCCAAGCNSSNDEECSHQNRLEVLPYLQSMTPTDVYVMWMSSSGTSSTVQYGTTQQLGLEATGTNSGYGFSFRQTHTVHLTGLVPDTVYYYRAITGDARSRIFAFQTPPLAADEASTRLVAMSDMQRDGSNPDVFRQIVEDGVVPYYAPLIGDQSLFVALDMILVPGDLVDNGFSVDEFVDTFFAPAKQLFPFVSLWPVRGNHEYDPSLYYQQFRLPEQAGSTHKERWWYVDRSNLRLIGLDSNMGGFNPPISTQLSWLDTVLDEACDATEIDFVFAELHHPHLSESWPIGESSFTTDVVLRLEEFSTTCGKPSVHFFGHTHAYSRGQSRDHRHLMVNVATAGGNIDEWGEYTQADVPEFSVSHAEYGFVDIEVEAGESPAFTVWRISRGNTEETLNNVVKDSVTIRRYNQAPNQPVGIQPNDTEVCQPVALLRASAFGDPDSQDLHGSSHWQISTDCEDFSNPVLESWRQHENWYGGEDLQFGDDLTDETMSGLPEDSSFCWRVRYRDRGLQWSAWSEPLPFSTGLQGQNLLTNPGAESGTDGWTTQEGNLESLWSGQCNGISPRSGSRYFVVGGLCDEASFGRARQRVTLSGDIVGVLEEEAVWVTYGGYLSNYGGDDFPEMYIEFYDDSDTLLSTAEPVGTYLDDWTMLQNTVQLPSTTRTIDFVLTGTRNAGTDNDSYFDDLSLRLSYCD